MNSREIGKPIESADSIPNNSSCMHVLAACLHEIAILQNKVRTTSVVGHAGHVAYHLNYTSVHKKSHTHTLDYTTQHTQI